MTESDFNPDDPLARISNETTRALSALHDYVALGGGRSLPLLTKGYRNELEAGNNLYQFFEKYRTGGEKVPSQQLATISGWSSRFHWQARVARLMEIRSAEREAQRLERLKELEDLDWHQGQALRDKVSDLLHEMQGFTSERIEETTGPDGEPIIKIYVKYTPPLGQVGMAAKIASELQRLSVGAATQNSRLVDKEGGDRDLPVVGIEIVNPLTPEPV